MPVAEITAVPRGPDGAGPAFLQLAGHPLRWRLLTELARSDRTVNELTGLVGAPQNLVSYHLGKLREAGLVVTRRSSADRRDAYYSADVARLGDLFGATGGALHPALAPQPPPGVPARRPKVRVLFLCTGNSSRSPMAEALLRARSNGAVRVDSAGSHPKPLHPRAVSVLRERYGIDIAGRRPRSLDAYADTALDWVITLCDRVREVCPELPGGPRAVHWSIPDPSAVPDDTDDAGEDPFERTADELDLRISLLLAVLAAPPDPSRRPTRRRHG